MTDQTTGQTAAGSEATTTTGAPESATTEKRLPGAGTTMAGGNVDTDTGGKPDAGKGGKGKGKAAPATTTAADGDGDGTGETAAAEPSWRHRIAGDDKKFLKTLDNFASEASFGIAYRALQQKLGSGEYQRRLGKDAKPEEIAAWRKENNVPEKWEDYKIEIGTDAKGKGRVPGEAEKPMLMAFAQFAHKKGWDNATANEMASWYYDHQDALAEQRSDRDTVFYTKSRDTLRDEMGKDFDRNMNALGAFRDSMPETLWNRIFSGRTADGNLIGDDPEFIRWAVQAELDRNPAATVVTSSGGTGRSVSDEIAEIKKYMRTNRSEYAKDERMQARYRELLDAEEKIKARDKQRAA